MANKRISQLPAAASPLAGGTLLPVELTTGDTKRATLQQLRPTVSVTDFGAVGDGVADDTAAIQAALDYAALNNAGVEIAKGIYKITARLLVKNGVRAIIGSGGIIRGTNANSYIALVGIYSGYASNVVGCVISGIQFDANNIATVGIYAENVQQCVITNNRIFNLPFLTGALGVVLRTFASGVAMTTFNVVSNNTITGSVATSAGGAGVAIDVLNADLNYGATGTNNPADYWKATFTAADATIKAAFNVVNGNTVYGALYGISLSAANYNNVSNNTLTQNIRGISVQNCCIGNAINGNNIVENQSSGVHLAYGSSFNHVSGNEVYSSRATGEGQLQAYLGCVDNTFVANRVSMVGSSMPQYMAYCAVKSSRNVFDSNTFNGAADRAMIGVESTWNTATTNPASRAYNNPSVGSGWSNAGMSGVIVKNNCISAANATRPAMFFYQVTQGTVCGLTDCVIECNTVRNANQNYQLELSEDTSNQINDFVVFSNSFFYSATVASFSFARGRACMKKCQNNLVLNDLNFSYDVPSGTTSVSVAAADAISTAGYASPTTITNFTNGMSGQVIRVRLSVNTSIQHNANIFLKGSVNISGGVDANSYVTLANDGTKWVEQSRNF